MNKWLKNFMLAFTVLALVISQFSVAFGAAAVSTDEKTIIFDSSSGKVIEKFKPQTKGMESSEVRDYSNIVSGKVLVKYKDGISSGVRNNISSLVSAGSVKHFDSLGISRINLPEGTDVFDAINILEADPNVEYAEPVHIRRALGQPQSTMVLNPDDPIYTSGDQWGLSVTEMVYAWEKVEPDEIDDVVVAVIDTGVDYNHADIDPDMLVDGWDFANEDADPSDDNGHGTHVAGIIGATIHNSAGIAGVAGGVKIMPVKVLNQYGFGTVEDEIEGILWAIENGADVINLSLGSEEPDEAEEDAIELAQEAGIVVVAATGNDYGSGALYPAAYSLVIAVGAVAENSNLAAYSNIYATVTAPGTNIISTIPIGLDTLAHFGTTGIGDSVQDGYTYLDGTSMAAPFVSGLAALMIASGNSYEDQVPLKSKNDLGRVFEVAHLLQKGAVDRGEEGFDDEYGAGVINGNRTFNLPRYYVTDVEYDVDNNPNKVTVGVTAFDYKASVNQSVYEAVYLEIYDWNAEEWDPILSTDVEIEAGYGTATVELPDVGEYLFKAEDADGNKSVISIGETIVIAPKAPVANVSSGSYDTTKQVSLSTTTSGAQIYYTLDGTVPTGSSAQYTGPITISSSKTLKAVAIKNGIESSISTYSYTIATSDIDDGDGGGGGGGGGGSLVEEEETGGPAVNITEDSSGNINAEVTVEIEDLEEDLDSDAASEVVITAKTETAVDKIEVNVAGDIFTKAEEKGKTIKIDTDNVIFEIQPGTIEVDEADSTVTFSATQLDIDDIREQIASQPEEADTVSLVFDFDLTVGNQKVTDFNKPINITVKFDSAKVKDSDKVGVYYYNEKDGKWEYVGGIVNDDGTVTFTVEHFSKYAVFEYNKTFKDIVNHWARTDIEKMAARHITSGVDADNFAPEAKITRAALATMIVRALNMKDETAASKFMDIKAGSWYADAVNKAYNAGIISGINESEFAPDANVTREQMAKMIMNAYSHATGKKLEDMITTMHVRFSDEDKASDWARRYITLANAAGLMQGNPDGSFAPKSDVTRAQAIVVIRRLLSELGVISK